jgi:hypothetical protein
MKFSSAIKSLFILLSTLFLYRPADAAPKTLWSIGSQDHSGREFAIFGNYNNYLSKFPSDFIYHLGQNNPSDWPYIQPGPVDSWAGSRQHSLSIDFTLDAIPTGECTLVLDLVSAQGQYPPVLSILINGSAMHINIPSGPGDAVLSDENAGHPSSTRLQFNPNLLKAGENKITISNVAGSWLLYDALHLETDPAVSPLFLSNASLKSAFFFLRKEGKLKQAIILNVYNDDSPGTAKAIVTYGKKTEEQSAPLASGDNSVNLMIDPVKTITPIQVTLTLRDHTIMVKGEALPQRKWTIYIIPSVHIDVGYTDLQSVARKHHDENLDNVIQMCKADPSFRWNLEGTWEAQNYLADRPASQGKELIKLLREGRIEQTAGYLNMLTGLMSNEEMNRYAYIAAKLHRRYGIPITSADLTDVPSANLGLEMALAGSGIKYFAEGINQDRALTLNNSNIRTPFYWEGTDGSRLLCWFSFSYGGSIWLDQHLNPSQMDMENWIQGIVGGIDQKSYPYNLIYIYGALYENAIINPDYANTLKQWNTTWAYPKLVFATESQFFQNAEKEYGNHFPVIRGSFGSYWEDGAASSALETTMNRNSQQSIVQGETLWALAKLRGCSDGYPASLLQAAWQQIFLYDEHTWGAAQSTSEPDSPMTKAQWAVKKEYAYKAAEQTNNIAKNGLKAYLKTIPAHQGDLVVCNTHSWVESGVVSLPQTISDYVRILDDRGQSVPLQNEGGKRLMYASSVPGLGCKVYHISKVRQPSSGMNLTQGMLENRFYKIQMSAAHGVFSVIDRSSGKELVDPVSHFSLGQVVYASGGSGTRLININSNIFPKIAFNHRGDALKPAAQTILLTPETIQSVSPISKGPIFSEVTVHSNIAGVAEITTKIRLYNLTKRIEFDIYMHKTAIRQTEAMYVAFPFLVKQPHIRMDTAETTIDPTRDMFKGACNDWYAIRDWVSCQGNDKSEIVWSSPDAPLITLSDINRGRWLPKADITNGYVFSYIMNNYWYTNYKADQGGDFHFRYAVTSSPHPVTPINRESFANNFPGDMPAGVSPGVSKINPPHFSIQGGNISIIAVKKAEDGNGYILRIRNMEDQPSSMKLLLSETQNHQAELDNMIEEKVKTLSAKHGVIDLPMKPSQTLTIRIRQ